VRKTALCLIRIEPQSRYQAFITGLSRLGFTISDNRGHRPGPHDVLLIWNRMGQMDQIAARWERAGATVLVTENGWIGSDKDGQQLYALCRSQHNGPGDWYVGDEPRWKRQNIRLEPWRKIGENLLILPQRGMGSPRTAMPVGWERSAVRRLQKATGRKIVIRPHPGRVKLEPHGHFINCHAAVTWGSGAAIKAIAAGIPVFYELPDWIGAPAAVRGLDNLEAPFLGDRAPMFKRLSWAQWELAEIASGEAFRCVCGLP
jgi:hypothetical protein